MRIAGVALIISVVTSTFSYGQTLTDSEMSTKIRELEKRVSVLESIIASSKPVASEVPGGKDTSDRKLWRKLQIGMSDDLVRSILGEPLRIEQLAGGFYTWQYSTETWHSTISFDRKGVMSWSEPD